MNLKLKEKDQNFEKNNKKRLVGCMWLRDLREPEVWLVLRDLQQIVWDGEAKAREAVWLSVWLCEVWGRETERDCEVWGYVLCEAVRVRTEEGWAKMREWNFGLKYSILIAFDKNVLNIIQNFGLYCFFAFYVAFLVYIFIKELII